MNEQALLHNPFNLETHKKTFIDYLEVILLEDGTIVYAVPSHQEMLIRIACQKLSVTRDELSDLCPKEYYADFMTWLCNITGCVALWNKHMIGIPNRLQEDAIKELFHHQLFQGSISSDHER